MVDQPQSAAPKKPRTKGTLSLPEVLPGMNKIKPNDNVIRGRGDKVGPDIPPDHDDKKDKKGSAEEDQKVIARMRKRMERCIAAESDNRKAAVDDRKFKAGNQWPADVAQQRNTDKRPCLTNNRMKTFVHQITNPARENRPSINISPVGSRSDKEAAKMYKGLIRSIERDSHADIAYDTAFDDAVTSGWGYIRLGTEWKSENSFDQVLVIRRVRNPFTVYLDPDRQEPDGSDARFGFVTEVIPEDEFELEYPKAQLIPWDQGGQGERYKNWITKDGIRVAEYFEVVQKPKRLVSLSTGYTGLWDDLDEVTQARIKKGAVDIIEDRESYERKVMYYKATALEVLESNEWIGNWIPLIPVIGDEIDIEGKVVLSGIIRDAKDAQRMANYWDSMITEFVALAPKAPYIGEEGQFEGHEQEWKTANTRSRPYLTYKGTSVDGNVAPPPQRQPPPGVPDGVVVAKQQAEQNMIATTGIRFDATMQERMNDESGRAIRELGRHTDIGAFHYYDNLGRALTFLGRQLVQAIGKVYNRKQVMTILREDDTEQNVTIDPNLESAYKEVQGPKGIQRFFNPSFGEYGVTVDIGPSYATKRQEASESMMAFVKAMPQTAQLVMDLIASEMDWPGAEKIAARLAKAISPQMLTADVKDVPPQIQALIQNLEKQSKDLTLQLQQAMKALQDKAADRDVKLQAIETNFESKLLAMLVKSDDSSKKIAAEQARATADIIMTEMRARRAETHDHALAHHAHILDRASAEHDHELDLDKMAHEPEPEPASSGAKADG